MGKLHQILAGFKETSLWQEGLEGRAANGQKGKNKGTRNVWQSPTYSLLGTVVSPPSEY